LSNNTSTQTETPKALLGIQSWRRRCREQRGMRAAGAGRSVTAAANEAAVGADRHFDDGARLRFAAAGGEGLATGSGSDAGPGASRPSRR